MMRVSVIVPVFEHWDLIPKLVECLRAQTIGTEAFELIIVDNGSSLIPSAENDPPFMRRLHCGKPGSYAARNAGVAAACGSVLAFTDADCRPQPRWLQEGLKKIDERTIVAGRVRIELDHDGTPNDAELYDLVMGFPQAAYVRRGYGVTANLFVPRAVLDRVGGFDEKRFSGGDAEFCRRAARLGTRVVFCEQAVVAHPARSRMEELVRKVRRVKGGQITSGPLYRRILYLAFTFAPPLRAWRRALGFGGRSVRDRLRVCMVQARLWRVGVLEALRLLSGGSAERR